MEIQSTKNNKNLLTFIFMLFISSCLWAPIVSAKNSVDLNNQINESIRKKHVMFVIGGGSHIHPTFEIVSHLISKNAKVTYVVTHDKTHADFIKLQKLGANVLCLADEISKINQKLTTEQKFILQNPSGNFVDQEWSGPLPDPAILNQYYMATFWDELLTLTKNINPDVVVYDIWVGSWGKYVARTLNLPAYLSLPITFCEGFKHTNFRTEVSVKYYQQLFPPTAKRIWAATYLKQKLGKIANDIDVNFPWPLPNREEAIFTYTYPILEGYRGYNSLGSKIIFAGYPDQSRDLTNGQKQIIESVKKFKGDKKLIFVSMGGEVGKPLEFFTMLGEALGNIGDNLLKNNEVVVALHPGKKVMNGDCYNAQAIKEFMEHQGITNFIVYDYFPLPELFKITDVIIGHGGANSSMQALQSNKPIILLPFGVDQLEMAKKLTALDLAITAPDELSLFDYESGELKPAYTSDIGLRSDWVNWLKKSVAASLEQSVETRKQKIDSLLKGEEGYKAIAEMILQN